MRRAKPLGGTLTPPLDSKTSGVTNETSPPGSAVEPVNENGPCAKPLKAQYEECTCQSQTGWHTGADACVYNLDCPYLPFRRMICDEGVCACHVGDEVVKTCPQGDTCKIDPWAMAESCCCMVR